MKSPVLLAVKLSNGHFMSSRLFHPDRHTLPSLQRWHSHLLQAIKLVESGDLHYLKGPGATARHKDFGDPWIDCQPRFTQSRNALNALARGLKTETVLLHTEDTWQPRRPFDR